MRESPEKGCLRPKGLVFCVSMRSVRPSSGAGCLAEPEDSGLGAISNGEALDPASQSTDLLVLMG